MQANPFNVKTYRMDRDQNKTDLESSKIGIQFTVTEQHFVRGELIVSKTFTNKYSTLHLSSMANGKYFRIYFIFVIKFEI